jgi:hypothetical protein
MEGLGELKHYIKAQNPDTLERAIQAAREEERIRSSNRGTKQYLRDNSKASKGNQQSPHTTGNCHNSGIKGHYAKFCTKKTENQKNGSDQSQKSVHQITCNYCKKVGHKIAECRKRLYNNSKKDAKNQQGTSDSSKKMEKLKTPGTGHTPGGRPSSSHHPIARALTCSIELKEDHLIVEIKQTVPNKVKLLLDTGSDLNLIKLSVLDPQVLVNEEICYRLTGINEHSTQTLGKVELTL